MDQFKKKSVREEVGGKAESLKGKVKEGVGRITGNPDLEAEGKAEQVEGKVRQKVGKAGRAISDAADRIKDKMHKG